MIVPPERDSPSSGASLTAYSMQYDYTPMLMKKMKIKEINVTQYPVA